MKKTLTLIIALLLVVSTGTMALAQGSDYESSWAKDEISYMLEKGVLAGYPDGTFKPQNNMSQAEFYRVINELMGYTEKGEVKFSDVKADDWYYGEVEKGVGANYILPGENLNADAKISRAEVARIISIVFDVESNEEAANSFKDNEKFSKEMKGIIGGLKTKGFISGRPDGTFDGQANITRAEAVRMLYTISGEILNKAETFSKDLKTNMIVNTAGVVLKDMTIDGDLYLAEGIGEGNVLLDGLTVKGHLSIQGGGVNSIIIKNSNINTVTIKKQEKPVRVVFDNTKVNALNTENGVKLEIINKSEVKMTKLNGDVDVKIEKDSSVDGEVLKTDSEFKVEDGKKEEVKEAVKNEGSSSGSSSSSSSAGTNYVSESSKSEKETIISSYRSDLRNLERESRSDLEAILIKARAEVEKTNKSEEAILDVYENHLQEAVKLEAETDRDVDVILEKLGKELKDKGYSTDSVAELRQEYKDQKVRTTELIKIEFKKYKK